MIVLGISGGVRSGNQDGSAALVMDGRLIAAAEEERFVGVKFANGLLPREAARWCLSHANISIQDVDRVVFPGVTYVGFRELLERFFRFHFGHSPRIDLVDHHAAHAASTFFASGFDRATVVTMDNTGEEKSTTTRRMTASGWDQLEEIRRPNSLGLFYSCVTQFLGFTKDSDEYKVMGMAAYGRPTVDFDSILSVNDEGYHFRADFVRGVLAGQPSPSKQEPLFEEFPLSIKPRLPRTPFAQVHFDVAASAQRQLERAALAITRRAIQRSGETRLCLAGGVALNCLMNQRLREEAGVSEIYVPPVASDAGLALGAAWLVAREGGDAIEPLAHACWGPGYSNDDIRRVLARAGAPFREARSPAKEAAERLERGRIVGWFQGRMEYGPRALGHRSILADPRRPDMKDLINQKVKFREEFRPIAPSVRHSAGERFFERYDNSPYMTRTFLVNQLQRERVPAIIHEDGTARLQSVHPDIDPTYDELLVELERRTGVPMLVNTSLNAYGDPMACEPAHALRTYFATGLDSLVIGDFVLDKPNS